MGLLAEVWIYITVIKDFVFQHFKKIWQLCKFLYGKYSQRNSNIRSAHRLIGQKAILHEDVRQLERLNDSLEESDKRHLTTVVCLLKDSVEKSHKTCSALLDKTDTLTHSEAELFLKQCIKSDSVKSQLKQVVADLNLALYRVNTAVGILGVQQSIEAKNEIVHVRHSQLIEAGVGTYTVKHGPDVFPVTNVKAMFNLAKRQLQIEWEDSRNASSDLTRYDIRLDSALVFSAKLPCDLYYALGEEYFQPWQRVTIEVRAVNKATCSPYTTPLEVVYKTTPTAPPHLTIKPTSTTSIEISFQLKAIEKVTRYIVRGIGFTNDEKPITKRNETLGVITLERLYSTLPYKFCILLVNEQGESGESEQVQVLMSSFIPGPPSELAMERLDDDKVRIQWRQPEHNAHLVKSYEIEKASSFRANWKRITSLPSSNFMYDVGGIDGSKNHFFRVCPVSVNGLKGLYKEEVLSVEKSNLPVADRSYFDIVDKKLDTYFEKNGPWKLFLKYLYVWLFPFVLAWGHKGKIIFVLLPVSCLIFGFREVKLYLVFVLCLYFWFFFLVTVVGGTILLRIILPFGCLLYVCVGKCWRVLTWLCKKVSRIGKFLGKSV